MSQTVVKFAKSAIKSQSYQYELFQDQTALYSYCMPTSLKNYSETNFMKCLFCFAIVMKFDMLNMKITLLFVYP